MTHSRSRSATDALARLALVATTLSPVLLTQNQPPAAPRFTEPPIANLVLNPSDVHMETAPFSDPNPGDQHAASDFEIWTISPSQRVWSGLGLTGLEKIHAHLGDGTFENSHAGWHRLFANTQFVLRARHKDDSGAAASAWSPWTTIPFSTGDAGIKLPMLLEDVDDLPGPTWTEASNPNTPIDLPPGFPSPMLRIETDTRWQLLRIDGATGPGNRVTNPPGLPAHRAIRVVVEAGNIGQNLQLPASDLRGFEHSCAGFVIHLPAIDLPPFSRMEFWVSDHGGTYDAAGSPFVPTFTNLARSVPLPWEPLQAGFTLDVVASNLRMPVNIAFAPNAGSGPLDPKFYVTELYGTIKVVTNNGTVANYATNLLNYTPSGAFPGSGEQGLAGIAVDPATGDVLVSHLWRTSGQNNPRITRLTSQNGGLTSSSRQVILDMQGEPQGQSHQISALEIVNDELFCHMGDGFNYQTAQNLDSFRGKILRLDLNGAPIVTNPFYNGGAITARDYVYCYGVRNPFGGAWRATDGRRYCVENGPNVDRLSRLLPGRNFGWNNTNSSMFQFALHAWDPSAGPVSIAFVQPQTFGGSDFPAELQDRAFVTESGATYAQGEQTIGKRLTTFAFDANGNVTSGPIPFVEYTGDGFATAVALAAGPDGLYFSEFYRDAATTGPTATGARILRIRYGDPLDCDGNGLPDSCELASGAADCNGNGVLDVCDLRTGTSHDFDGNGIPDECDPLFASADEVSLSSGGSVAFDLDAGPTNAGQLYRLLGSMTGTTPGTQFGGLTLPINSLNDPWFQLTSTVFSPAILQGTVGQLDATGRAQAAIVVPPLPLSLLGITFHHAYLVTDPATLPLFTSNAVPLTMTP